MKSFNMTFLIILLFFIALPDFSSSSDVPPIRGMQGYGSGMVDDVTSCTGIDNCMVVDYSGTAKITVVGIVNWTAMLTVDWNNAIPNGTGGLCTPSSGPVVSVTNDGSTMTMAMVGLFCSVDTTPPMPPFTYNGSYFISQGTGLLEEAAGSGSLSASTDENLRVLVNIHGTIIK